jgi:hypothetical protein
LAKPRAVHERCELCGTKIPPEHTHLLHLKTRQLACACEACGILFSDEHAARYRRVPRDVVVLNDLRLSDETWESLHIPINLAFFYRDSAAGKLVAMYPSPAGAMQSVLSMESLDQLIAENAALRNLQSDVAALLVNRVGANRDALIVPIDACFKLVGLIRSHWRGLSGGREVWDEIEQFFNELYRRAGAPRSETHA